MIVVVVAAEATFSHLSTALSLCICSFVFLLFFSYPVKYGNADFCFIIFRTRLSFPAKLIFCQAKFGKSYIFFHVAFAVLFQPPHKIQKNLDI